VAWRAFSVLALAGASLLLNPATGRAAGGATYFRLGNLAVVVVDATEYLDGTTTTLVNRGTRTIVREFDTTNNVFTTNAYRLPARASELSGSNRRFVNSGTATSEGRITLSADGRFLMLSGYDAELNQAGNSTSSIANGTTAAQANRVIARIDWTLSPEQGAINTTTALGDAFNTNNIRGVTSVDGSSFFVAGNSSGTPASGGVRFATLGATTSTSISATPNNCRTVQIVNGQLYMGSGSGGFLGVNRIGVGLPTTSGQTATLLTSQTAGSSYDFFFADANTLYIADDRSTATGGGLQKWTFDGTTWTLRYTISAGLTGPAGLLSLAGTVAPNGVVTIFGITAEAAGGGAGTAVTRIVKITDALTNTTLPATTFQELAVAPANTAFRGLTLISPTVTGTLGTSMAPGTAPRIVSASVRNTGDANTLFTLPSLVVTGDGPFYINNFPFGMLDLALRGTTVGGSTYLRRVIAGIDTTASSADVGAYDLLPGDLNGDDFIDLFDLITFFEAYGTSSGDSNYSANADINGDGIIDLFDLIGFFSSYGASSDP
jgi:hypothetical protein